MQLALPSHKLAQPHEIHRSASSVIGHHGLWPRRQIFVASPEQDGKASLFGISIKKRF